MKKTLFCLGVLFLFACALFADTGTVTQTLDGRSFDYTAVLLKTTPAYRQWSVTYPSPEAPFWEQAKLVKAYYYEPVNASPDAVPGVLCLHILGGNGKVTEAIASSFASRGLPALMPMMPLFLDRRPQGGMEKMLLGPNGPNYLAAALTAIPGDIRRSLDFLASRPGVDGEHLNVIGTSLGGILSVSTAGSDPRVEKAVFLLAGGNLKQILTLPNPEVIPLKAAIDRSQGAQRRKIDEAFRRLEPMNYLPQLSAKARDGRIRMYNAGDDTIVPPANSDALAKGLGLKKGKGYFVFQGLNHYSAIVGMQKILADSIDFFMPADGVKLSPANASENSSAKGAVTEQEIVKGLFGEFAALLEATPETGKACRVAGNVRVSENGKESFDANFFFATDGTRFRFSLDGVKNIAEIEGAAFGCSETPWALSAMGTCFRGDETPAPTFAELLPEKLVAYRQLAAMMLRNTAMSGSLDFLRQFGAKTRVGGAGKRSLQLSLEGYDITMQPQGKGYGLREIKIVSQKKKIQASIRFREWETAGECTDALFEPEEGSVKATKIVNADDLVRSVAAAFGYLMKNFDAFGGR